MYKNPLFMICSPKKLLSRQPYVVTGAVTVLFRSSVAALPTWTQSVPSALADGYVVDALDLLRFAARHSSATADGLTVSKCDARERKLAGFRM